MSDFEKMPIPKNLVEDNLITPEFIEAMPSPRVIKTHQMLATLNPDILTTCKVSCVYVLKKFIKSTYFQLLTVPFRMSTWCAILRMLSLHTFIFIS